MSNHPKSTDAATRTAGFEENEKLNALLGKLSAVLRPVQQGLSFDKPQCPVGCIIGNPRSGTTILQQWMASLGVFSYPTNLLTRFSYAPYIGALTQKMLFDPDYDYHGDFQDIRSEVNFQSDLGKSKGALACNEFQHFFRNHMPNFDLEWLDGEALNRVDCSGIEKGLASIEAVLEKPFVTKGSLMQLNLDYFSERLSNLFWIHITRDPIYVMQSILTAREAFYGDRSIWWSSKPKEYRWLKDMDVHHQIAGQVFFTDKAIEDALTKLPDDRWMAVQYESFCNNPIVVYESLHKKYMALDFDLHEEYLGATSFKASNEIRLPASDIDALQTAYTSFQNGLHGDR